MPFRLRQLLEQLGKGSHEKQGDKPSIKLGKCQFMVDEGIVLGHKISSKGMEVDRAKIDVISKLPPPTSDCIQAFNLLKQKLVSAPIVEPPDWTLPFELMCDASDYAVGAVLGQRKGRIFIPYTMLVKH
ncbi:hypothetical protein GQ457_05G024390 [Hibiscus cannabinus]